MRGEGGGYMYVLRFPCVNVLFIPCPDHCPNLYSVGIVFIRQKLTILTFKDDPHAEIITIFLKAVYS